MPINSEKSLAVAREAFERFGYSWTEMRKHAVRKDGVLIVKSSKAPRRRS